MLNKDTLIITKFAGIAASLQGATIMPQTDVKMSGKRSLWLAIKLSGQTVM